ncbi:MAG: hypothetical protein L6V88_01025 [Anaerotruncus sp.]|nr:MAG: hypothetical protein L6V88_01025 [Anaerotruncus sp.]
MAAIVICLALVFTNVISFMIAQCIVGALVAIGLFITVMEFLMYKQFMDGMYKK